MEKISFVVPTENKVTENKVTENKVTENKVIEDKNKNGYSKITTNVYRFNSVSIIINKSNIYNEALHYRQIGNLHKSIELFKMCEKELDDSIVETHKTYELYVNLGLLTAETNGSFETVSNYYCKATQLCPDRAEPYYYFAIYCNKTQQYEQAYDLLIAALKLSYDDVKNKYNNVQKNAYEKHLYDELSVTCYWLKKYEDSKGYLLKIINDDDFIDLKPRLSANLEQIEKELHK
jgi:tetratricopeptide (TPR) repeat protein